MTVATKVLTAIQKKLRKKVKQSLSEKIREQNTRTVDSIVPESVKKSNPVLTKRKAKEFFSKNRKVISSDGKVLIDLEGKKKTSKFLKQTRNKTFTPNK